MLSPRRTAQLVLGLACFILVASVMVLVAGTNEAGMMGQSTGSSHIEPIQAQMAPPLTIAKQ